MSWDSAPMLPARFASLLRDRLSSSLDQGLVSSYEVTEAKKLVEVSISRGNRSAARSIPNTIIESIGISVWHLHADVMNELEELVGPPLRVIQGGRP